MKWEVSCPLRPFSQDLGTKFLIPGSSYVATSYPNKVELSLLGKTQVDVLELNLPCFLTHFHVVQDLEYGLVRVMGHLGKELLDYTLKVNEKGLELNIKRAPKEGIVFVFLGKNQRLHTKESWLLLPEIKSSFPKLLEKLFLGSHKKQDTYAIMKRGSICEILPFLYRLGQLSKETLSKKTESLEYFRKLFESTLIKEQEELFIPFIEGAFESFLVPSEIKDKHLKLPFSLEKVTSMAFLHEVYQVIKESFVKIQGDEIHLLPHLPKVCHSGYLTNIEIGPARLDLVFSKSELARVRITGLQKGELKFSFPKELKSCRLKHKAKEKGVDFVSGNKISFKASESWILDRFQK